MKTSTKISPRIRPLLREILGADEEAAIGDELIEQVADMLREVKYLDAVFGDSYDANIFQFSSFAVN